MAARGVLTNKAYQLEEISAPKARKKHKEKDIWEQGPSYSGPEFVAMVQS